MKKALVIIILAITVSALAFSSAGGKQTASDFLQHNRSRSSCDLLSVWRQKV